VAFIRITHKFLQLSVHKAILPWLYCQILRYIVELCYILLFFKSKNWGINMSDIDFYDELHNKADDRAIYHREIIALKELEKLLNQQNRICKVIDVGCGHGTFLKVLSEKFKAKLNLYGTEFSEHQLQSASKTVPVAEFVQANFSEGLPYEKDFFDVVYSGEVIEHLYNPDHFVSELNRILSNNGTLILSTPNLCNWISRIFFLLGVYPIFYESSTKNSKYGFGFLRSIKRQSIPVGHIRLMNLDALKCLLTDQGFEIQKVKGFTFSGFRGILLMIDKLFSHFPGSSSGFVIVAKKKS
jgi:2-polyprenyl-3-methyl-5-hydroxy-6-metoxy-1,4-benzoquinol methylase